MKRELIKTFFPMLRILMFMALYSECQSCNRYQISPSEELNEIATKYGGIPNIGNTCYMNSGLQIIARLYPDLFSHMNNNSGRYGQAIVDKITSENRKEFVTREEAKAFFEALLASYNKHHTEQLHHGNQEDGAPVLDFLLHQGNIQEIAFYVTKNPVSTDDTHTPTIADNPTTGRFIIVTPTPTVTSMATLVQSTLRGHLVEDADWENAEGNQVVRDRAMVGYKLENKNLRELTNRILPIWVHRFGQTSNHAPSSASKITTPITNPFKLTIAAEHLIEKASYTSSLLGFIYHEGDLNSGHYMAYIKNKAGRWIKYNDETVTELNEKPLKEAQEAYLYFYQAD